MNRKALPFALAVAALLSCALPAVAFPPQCTCKYCWQNPNSMCLVGPVFFDCVDWYENYCRLSTSAGVKDSEEAAVTLDGTSCVSPVPIPAAPVSVE